MAGAHTPRSLRTVGEPTPPGARPVVPRGTGRQRGVHGTGTGWWQTPGRQRRSEEPARHRAGPGTVRRRRRAPAAPAERRTRRLRLVRTLLLAGVAGTVLVPVLALAVGYLVFAVPSPDAAVDKQVALVSYGDGSPLARLVPEAGNRIKVPVGQVPVHVREAVLAAEDRSFYSHPGFDVTGVLRALWNQLRGGTGGGSTITQQYVKNALVGDAPSLWRKYREVVLAVKISQERSKDEILGDYLNTIYFGRGAYGIQSAALAYFGKDVQDLTVGEGALLAGLIQSPSRWDPAVSPDRAVERWTFVLDGMAAAGRLDPAGRAAQTFRAPAPRRRARGGAPGHDRGHIVSAVTAELQDLGISEQDLAQQGLRITTTIDPVRQRQAVEAARGTLAGQPGDLRSAMVAVDPASGGVLAYYGGDNGLGMDYARAERLAGSTFKPFVVLAGLVADPPVGVGEVFDGAELPGLRNADGAECDRCDLKQAMTVSNNVVFHGLARAVGPRAVADAARAAGVTAPLADPDEGIALGNEEVSTLDLASAYATIAAGGVWHPPHLVRSVVTADGTVLYKAATGGERRFPERVARNVTETMLGVAARDGLALPDGRPVAAKTGTVESRLAGENNDAWTAGFTPDLATSVWMGTDLNSPIRTASGVPVEGSTLPGRVWREFMGSALEAEPVREFAPFRPIGEAPSGAPSGTAPTPSPTPTAVPAATTTPEPTPTAPDGPPATPLPPPSTGVTPTPAPRPDDRGGQDRRPPGDGGSPAPTSPPPPDCPAAPCG